MLVSSKVNMIMMMARAAMRLVDRRQIAALVATVVVPHECGVSDETVRAVANRVRGENSKLAAAVRH